METIRNNHCSLDIKKWIKISPLIIALLSPNISFANKVDSSNSDKNKTSIISEKCRATLQKIYSQNDNQFSVIESAGKCVNKEINPKYFYNVNKRARETNSDIQEWKKKAQKAKKELCTYFFENIEYNPSITDAQVQITEQCIGIIDNKIAKVNASTE